MEDDPRERPTRRVRPAQRALPAQARDLEHLLASTAGSLRELSVEVGGDVRAIDRARVGTLVASAVVSNDLAARVAREDEESPLPCSLEVAIESAAALARPHARGVEIRIEPGAGLAVDARESEVVRALHAAMLAARPGARTIAVRTIAATDAARVHIDRVGGGSLDAIASHHVAALAVALGGQLRRHDDALVLDLPLACSPAAVPGDAR